MTANHSRDVLDVIDQLQRRVSDLEGSRTLLTARVAVLERPPMFRMFQTIAQPISNTTDTQVLCDTSQYDTANSRASSSPWPYIIPAGYGGKWQFVFMTPYASNTTGSRASYLKINGVRLTQGTETEDVAANNDVTSSVGVLTVPVNDGDSVTLWTWQNSGGPLNLAANSVDQSFLEGRLTYRGN